ncbi:MAG: DUF3467 domain-containing protein [Deltaproteobacteria bacterium]|nr:DUF3467 domain-containing protein [Deltaproteobacteria bacterium]
MAENPQPQQLQINLDEETAQGTYCNLALLSHSESEFTFDFIYVQPQQPKAKVRARIITNPAHAKRLAQVLAENIARYEARFGEIKLQSPPPDIAPRH